MMAKILLVEDNPVTKKLISTALLDAGYRVVEASSATAALRLINGSVELVLVDASLPDGDGAELLSQLRSAGDEDVPILALSEETDESRLLAAGFTDVLGKPIDTGRLLSAVRIHLAHGTADPPGDGRALLLVDSSPRSLRLAARRFEQLGFDVLTAADGREALERLAQTELSVVVSELLTDAMDGFELCQAIHASPEHATLPVVLTSSQQLNQVEREFALRIGASAVVTRTADLNALVDAVLDAIRPRSRRSRAPQAEKAPVSRDYHRHAISTLEHRANLREDLARRDGTLRAVRAVLDCLNDLGGRGRDDVLYGVLAAFLDATGFSLGAAYLKTPEGSLELRQHIGFPDERAPEVGAFWGHLPLLLGVTEMGEPRGATASHAVGSIQQVLAAAQLASIVLVPLTHGARRLGVLLLGSRNARLSSDWLLLAETVAGPIANVVLLAETSTQLLETEKRFQGIADSTTEGIVVCDAERQVNYANTALLNMLAVPPADVVGRSIDEVLPFLADTGDSAQGTVLRGDGTTLPCEATARTLNDPAGRPCRVYVVRDLSERVRLSQVAWLASHDALTGLYNRHRFEEDLAQRLSESRRYSTGCAILLIDIDHFKLINDTYGHQAGDSVLSAIADVLRKTTRESDVPARLGGDEFIVLLPHAGLDQGRACASKLLERVKQLNPTYQGWSLPVSISIGVAAYPQHGEVPEALITSADEALYRAKHAGRNQVCVHDQDALSTMSRLAVGPRLALEAATAANTEEPPSSSVAQNG